MIRGKARGLTSFMLWHITSWVQTPSVPSTCPSVRDSDTGTLPWGGMSYQEEKGPDEARM